MTDRLPSLLEYEYTSNFFCHFHQGNCFRDILFIFPEVEALSKELYSYNIEFFLGMEPNEKQNKNGTGKVASPKYVSNHLIVIRHIAMLFLFYFRHFTEGNNNILVNFPNTWFIKQFCSSAE